MADTPIWAIEGVALESVDPAVAGSLAAVALGIEGGTDKIDGAAVDGLLGVSNSLAYKVHELERHFHGRERWRGKLAVQTATDWADDVLTPFRAISGANAYGAEANDEALVLGTADTPAIAGNTRFDLHRLIMTGASSSTAYKLRIVYGTGTMADAVAAGTYTEVVVMSDPSAAQVPHEIIDVMMPRGTCGSTKVWVQAWNATDNATFDFLVGWHEYEG